MALAGVSIITAAHRQGPMMVGGPKWGWLALTCPRWRLSPSSGEGTQIWSHRPSREADDHRLPLARPRRPSWGADDHHPPWTRTCPFAQIWASLVDPR